LGEAPAVDLTVPLRVNEDVRVRVHSGRTETMLSGAHRPACLRVRLDEPHSGALHAMSDVASLTTGARSEIPQKGYVAYVEGVRRPGTETK